VAEAGGSGQLSAGAREATSDTFLYFGALAGIAGVVSLVTDFLTPSAATASGQLASFRSEPNLYVLYLVPLAFAFLITPFLVSLGSVLQAHGADAARAAALLLVLAVFSLGIAGAFEYGGYWAASVTPAPSAAAQAYQAAFWSNVNDAWENVSIYGVGMGTVLLAWSVRQSHALPSWMVTLGWIGGALDLIGAGLASLSGYYGALSVGFVLPVFGLIILIILSFTIPRSFRRHYAVSPPGASSPT
jgi:hypothetical protein